MDEWAALKAFCILTFALILIIIILVVDIHCLQDETREIKIKHQQLRVRVSDLMKQIEKLSKSQP